MRTKLFLLLVLTFSGLCSQNTNTFSSSTNVYDADAHRSTKTGALERFSNPVNNNNQFSTETSNSKTTKPNVLERHRIWLNMTNTGGAFKQILVGYIQGATNGYDSDFDGISLDANPYIDFYSINSDRNLVIQGRALPFSDTDEVPLGYRTVITGNFTIAIDHSDGLLINHPVFLEDKHTNTIHDLSLNPYIFSTIAGTFKNRFVLTYKNQVLGTSNLESNHKILVRTNNNRIDITSNSQNIETVMVYNSTGELIYKDNAVYSNQLIINDVKQNNGLLLVKILLENNQIVTKKIIY